MTAQPKDSARNHPRRKTLSKATAETLAAAPLATPCEAVAAELRVVASTPQSVAAKQKKNTTGEGSFFLPQSTNNHDKVINKTDKHISSCEGRAALPAPPSCVPSRRRSSRSAESASILGQEKTLEPDSPPPDRELGGPAAAAWMAERVRSGWSAARVGLALGSGKGWSPATAAEAWAAWVRTLEDDLSALSVRGRLALAVEQREALAEQALRKGDFRMALAAWDSRDRFLGLTDRNPDEERQAAQTLVKLMELARK